jgi:hypothetical protein
VVSCGTGFTNCSGVCRDLATDNNNCGACARVCPTGQVCTGSVCTTVCSSGLTNCSGVCRSLATDNANCGACGNVCASGLTCVSGACTLVCGSGQTACSGVCRNLQTDNTNCGVCGRVCATGQVCTNGVCSVTCATGQTNCSGVCRNLSSDNANCGACGRACSTGQACVSGVCVGQGTLRFTLTWDTAGDMDLHVQPPCGTSIYYGNPSACGGTLDVDDTTQRGPENIFWSSSYTPGTYRVCPEAYSSTVANSLWTLVVIRGGVEVHRSSGRRGRTDGYTPCNSSFPGVITLNL